MRARERKERGKKTVENRGALCAIDLFLILHVRFLTAAYPRYGCKTIVSKHKAFWRVEH